MVMVQHTFPMLAHNCSRKDERKYGEILRGREGRSREGSWKEEAKRVGGERKRAHSDFFGFSQVLCAFYFGPSLPLSMLRLQHAMPFSPFAPDEILLPSATGSNASKPTRLMLLLF